MVESNESERGEGQGSVMRERLEDAVIPDGGGYENG